MDSIFDYPDLWEAFDARCRRHHHMRSIRAEVNFLERLLKRYACHPVHSILEIACGTAPHGRVLARRGYRVVGIDRSPAMVRVARQRAREEGLKLQIIQRDGVRFTLRRESFDAAFIVAEMFPLAPSNEEIVAHLRSVARHLRPAGLYLIDKEKTLGLDPMPGHVVWDTGTFEIEDATITWQWKDLRPDVEHGVQPCVLECTIRRAGRTIRTRDVWQTPVLLPPHLEALARLSGAFRLEALHEYGRMTPGLRLNLESYVAVLRRTGKR